MNLVLTTPGIYLRELQQELQQHLRIWIDLSTVCRTLKRLGMTRQKIKHVALQASEQNQMEFIAEMQVLDPSLFVWIDETGCDRRNCLRKFGYGIRGQPPKYHSLKLRGKHFSAIAIMSTNGIEDVYITEGLIDGDYFWILSESNYTPYPFSF